MGCIYKITNTINNKCYIGETKLLDPYNRWKKHLWAIKANKGCPLLRKAINKYGENHFKFDILIICFDDDRFELEKLYIKKYKSLVPNGYNIQEGGLATPTFLGKKHTEKAKELMRQNKQRGLLCESNTNKYEKQVLKRKNMTNETKEKIRMSINKYYVEHGYCKSNSEKISKSMCKIRGRRIWQYSIDNKFIKEYETITHAASENKINPAGIQQNAAGRSNTSGGFIWRYADKYSTINSFFSSYK